MKPPQPQTVMASGDKRFFLRILTKYFDIFIEKWSHIFLFGPLLENSRFTVTPEYKRIQDSRNNFPFLAVFVHFFYTFHSISTKSL